MLIQSDDHTWQQCV